MWGDPTLLFRKPPNPGTLLVLHSFPSSSRPLRELLPFPAFQNTPILPQGLHCYRADMQFAQQTNQSSNVIFQNEFQNNRIVSGLLSASCWMQQGGRAKKHVFIIQDITPSPNRFRQGRAHQQRIGEAGGVAPWTA